MPHLRRVVGLDSFAQESGQWQLLLQSGLRTGRELQLAHSRFRVAVQDARGQPGIPVLEGAGFAPLAGDPSQREVDSFAGKCKDGVSTVQQAMLCELERVRLVRLERDVKCYLPRDSQLRWALEECDVKVSALPLAALPTPGQCITNLQYVEGAARYLGVDSPLCVGRVGQNIAGKKHKTAAGEPWQLDRYGNNIFSVALEDQYRTRHDGVKLVIPRVARWAGVRCTVEVYGHFAGLLSQEALEALDTKRKRQGLHGAGLPPSRTGYRDS